MTTQSNTKTVVHTPASHSHSSLTKFHLSFEYDRSWHEAKQTVQLRPTKK